MGLKHSYEREVYESAGQLQKTLKKYDETHDGHLKDMMDRQLSNINSAAKEIGKKGVHKQHALIIKDYQKYIAHPDSADNLSKLENDLSTLKDYVRQPPKMPVDDVSF